MTLTMTILTNVPMTIMIMVIMVMLKNKTTKAMIQAMIMMAVKLVDPIMRTMKTSVPKTTKY